MAWFKSAQSASYILGEEAIAIHDVDRSRTDRYECYIALIKSATSYDIGFHINNSQLGVASNIEYWHYPLTEKAAAQAAYKQVVDSMKNIVAEFEVQNTPFSLYGPRMRYALRQIDPNYKEISGVYHTNQNIKNALEG